MLVLVAKKKLKKLYTELTSLRSLVESMNNRQEASMGQVFNDLKTLTEAVNVATNQVGERITELTNKITNSMSDEELQAVKDGLQAEVDRLNALGSDPSDPIP